MVSSSSTEYGELASRCARHPRRSEMSVSRKSDDSASHVGTRASISSEAGLTASNGPKLTGLEPRREIVTHLRRSKLRFRTIRTPTFRPPNGPAPQRPVPRRQDRNARETQQHSGPGPLQALVEPRLLCA